MGSGKLTEKTAIITGGDSGIGRAAAIAFAREGADIVISYLNEHDDAEDTVLPENLYQSFTDSSIRTHSDQSPGLTCLK